MSEYEIIGKLPILRKRFGFYRNSETNKLSFGSYFQKVEGTSLVGQRETASTKEEANLIASKMLTSERGFESVVIQSPEEGAMEFWVEENNDKPD